MTSMTIEKAAKGMIIISLLLFLIPSAACGLSVETPNGLPHRNKLSAQVDVAYPVSSGFRTIYGLNLHFMATFHRQVNDKYGWKLSLSLNLNKAKELPLDYRELALALAPTYSMYQKDKLHLYGASGLGLSLRQVKLKSSWFDDYYGTEYQYQVTQRELSIYLELSSGIEYLLSDHVLAGFMLSFNTFPFSDPTIGKLGNTGGFRFGFMLSRLF